MLVALACTGTEKSESDPSEVPLDTDTGVPAVDATIPSVPDDTDVSEDTDLPVAGPCGGPITLPDGRTFGGFADAFAAAAPYDELLVCPGTYSGWLLDLRKPLTITAIEGAATTTLYGNYTRALLVDAPDVVIRGFTLDGDEVDGDGAALKMSPGSGVTLEDCVVTQGQILYEGDDGGGIYVGESAVLTLVRTVVSANTGAARGGGIFLASKATADLIDSAVTANDGDSAALYLSSGSTVTLDAGSGVTSNTAYVGPGGAIIEPGARLVSLGADWGEGPTENAGGDIVFGGVPFGPFGPGATFTCESGSCTP